MVSIYIYIYNFLQRSVLGGQRYGLRFFDAHTQQYQARSED